jgi:hypothetical protein
MNRRTFMGAVACGLLAGPDIADAQQAGRVPVVGVLITDARNSVTLPTFVQGLRDLGYVDGKNVTVDIRSADGKASALAGLAAELVQRRSTSFMPPVRLPSGPPLVLARSSRSSHLIWKPTRLRRGGSRASPARAAT